MAQARCGYNDTPLASGSDMLMLLGPTLMVNIGFDPNFKPVAGRVPTAAVSQVQALVDTGAKESCIDNMLAAALKLPIVDRQPVSGSNGRHIANIYEAQVHIPSLSHTIIGRFAGVELIGGGQKLAALIGRTFLQGYTMIYEGATGTVTLA